MTDSFRPHGLQPTRLLCPDKNSGEFSRQEYWSGLPLPSPGNLPDLGSSWVFLIQGLNLGPLHCRQTPYHLSHKGFSVSILDIRLLQDMLPSPCSFCQNYLKTITPYLLGHHPSGCHWSPQGHAAVVPLKLPPALLTSQLCRVVLTSHLLLPLAAALG